MRNPRVWRNVALCALATGPLAIAAAVQLPSSAATDPARAMGFVYGVSAILFGAIGALVLHVQLKAKLALSRGEDVLARWRIDAAHWRDFLALNSELDRAPGAYSNELSVREEVPAEGIEVIAGKFAIEIDGDFHALPARGTPEITRAEFHAGRDGLSYIELDLYYPGGGQGASGVPMAPKRSCLRVPVPPGAQGDAERLVAHYGGNVPATPDFFHGRGDGSDPEDLSKCWSCGFETYRFQSHCPQCGSVLQSRRWSRRLGVVMTACGVIVTGIAGGALYFETPLLLHPGVEIDGSRFDGTPGFALGVLTVFAALLAFGITALLYGIWQIKTGRRNKKVVSAMTAIVSLLMMLAWLFRATQG